MNYIHKIIIFLHRVKSILHKQYKLNLCCFSTNPSVNVSVISSISFPSSSLQLQIKPRYINRYFITPV